jgi:hypothetical protein
MLIKETCTSTQPSLASRAPDPPPEDLRFPATLVTSSRDFFLLAIRSWTAGHYSVAYCMTSATRAQRVPAAHLPEIVLQTITILLDLDLFVCHMSCQVRKGLLELDFV